MSAAEVTPPTGIADRLRLQAAGRGRWRSQHGDANQNGRSYGGQLLGQAMRAALMEVPAGRAATMMQFVFLQGAMPDRPILFEVDPLQEGKRFSSRHVRGTQGERAVLNALVSCAASLAGPGHAEPTTMPEGEKPEDLATLDDVPEALRARIALMGGYGRDCNPSIAFRIPDAARQLDATQPIPHFRYWMKVPRPLPDEPAMHAAAFAYLSDWWLNYCILRPHLPRAGERRMYISSLNHALWLHAPPQADQWLHVHATSAHAAHGRGLATAQFHDASGRHVATASQDCLVSYSD